MADSLTDLFNAAFGALGDDISIQDASTSTEKKAALARLRWPFVRDSLLRHHPWNCAVKRASLAKDVTTPLWEFDNYFTLPTDPWCLRVLQIENIGLEYQIEGRKLVANAEAVNIRYIGRIEPFEMDAQLVDCMIDALAAELAMPLLGSAGIEARKSLLAGLHDPRGKLQLARTADGQEGMARRSRSSPFVDVRQASGDVAGPKVWMNE